VGDFNGLDALTEPRDDKKMRGRLDGDELEKTRGTIGHANQIFRFRRNLVRIRDTDGIADG
jgi:hypothetical protein